MELQPIKRKDYFEKIIKEGKKKVNSHFVVYFLPSLFFEDNITRIGISVGKKIGNAVVRNLHKRHLRHIIRESKIDIDKKYVIIIMRPRAKDCDFSLLSKKFDEVMQGVK